MEIKIKRYNSAKKNCFRTCCQPFLTHIGPAKFEVRIRVETRSFLGCAHMEPARKLRKLCRFQVSFSRATLSTATCHPETGG